MLILSRKRNEKIMIGDDISIMIVDIRGDQVQIEVRAAGSCWCQPDTKGRSPTVASMSRMSRPAA